MALVLISTDVINTDGLRNQLCLKARTYCKVNRNRDGIDLAALT